MGVRSWWGRRRGAREVAPAVPPAPTEADVVAALERVRVALREGQAPPVVTTRVERIARTITDTLPRLRGMGLGSPDAYAVVATATTYLPEAVDGYLRLPRDWADTRPVEGHKTALMVLVDSLELLAATMVAILDAAARADAQALVAHGRFLQARFAPASGLDLGPT